MPDFFRQLTVGQRRLTIVVALLVCGHIGFSAYQRTRRVGDFDVLRGFGEQLLRGETLYGDGGTCYNYMPITALYNLPSALTPSWFASLWRSASAVGCLLLAVRMLARMTGDGGTRSPRETFAIAAPTLLLASHYLVRDLDDAGPHTVLLAVLVGGAYCVWQSRERLAALWFGLAVALKMTPGLLLPYFVWKRQFRLAAYTAVAAGAWIALPALWMGPQAWWTAQSTWNQVALRALSGRSDANEDRFQNQALKPAIERLLVAYPPGDPRRSAHPLDVTVLDLQPSTARRIAQAVQLALLAACAWYARRPFAGPRDPRRLVEFAGLLLMMTLYSPVTWLQHLPWIVPALWLLVERVRTTDGGEDARLLRAGLGLFAVMALALNRELVGRSTYYLLLSWHMHTVCQLLLLGLLARTMYDAHQARSARPVASPAVAVRRAA